VLTGFILVVALILLFWQFGMRYVLTYRFSDEDVRAVLFGVVPVSIRRYEFIKEVQVLSPLAALFWPTNMAHSRFIARGVLISYGSVFFRAAFYTPDNVEEFARELRRRVYQRTGQLPSGS
jgi:hypothetical protein